MLIWLLKAITKTMLVKVKLKIRKGSLVDFRAEYHQYSVL